MAKARSWANAARQNGRIGYSWTMHERAQTGAQNLPRVFSGNGSLPVTSRPKLRAWNLRNLPAWLQAGVWRQHAAALVTVGVTAVLNSWLDDYIGYQTVALIYLLAVVVLALFLSRGPTIFGAALSAFAWAYFSVPPTNSAQVSSFYDQMMLVTYFVVAITIGQLTTRLRAHRESVIEGKLLAESERLSRTLLNSVSHELRTPIAAITSAAGGLRDSGQLNTTQQKLAAEIESASARLNRLVQSLLSAARIQAGQIRPKMDWCDVADVIRVTLNDVAGLTARHEIQTRIAPRLPLVKMDYVLMQQVLANLLANAAMHTPPGTRVEVAARLDGARFFLDVADGGPGLPPEELPRIFDLFHRSPGARPGGTGLGLAIVKGLVEAQGGTVAAANRPGGGAQFTICLPAGEAPDIPEENP